jgi:hypothetical protein
MRTTRPAASSCSLLSLASPAPFLFALSLFLPSWCVPASSPSLLVIIFGLTTRISHHRRILSTHCTNRDTKKRIKKGGIWKAYHKIVLILVFYFCAHIIHFVAIARELWPDRFSFSTQFNIHPDPSLLLRATTDQHRHSSPFSRGTDNSAFGDRRSWTRLSVLARLRAGCPVHPSCVLDSSTRVPAQSVIPRLSFPVNSFDFGLHLATRRSTVWKSRLSAKAACPPSSSTDPRRQRAAGPVFPSAIISAHFDAHSAPTIFRQHR